MLNIVYNQSRLYGMEFYMGKKNPPLMEYTSENLEIVSKLILANLSTDLLTRTWIERNKKNSVAGHCHNASGCLYKIFGCDAVKMYRGLDSSGDYHWWVVDRDGQIIDLTSSQYNKSELTKIYKSGEKMGLLGFGYRRKVLTLLDRISKLCYRY